MQPEILINQRMKTSKKVKLTGSMSELENLLNSQMSVVKGGEIPPSCDTCSTCEVCSSCVKRQ